MPENLMSAPDKKFTVVIDPGHGGKDAGAIGATSKEKNINLAVSLKLGLLLEKEKDVQVIYTRKTDEFISLDERPRIANKAKADLFISIHTNAAKGKLAVGTETYVVGSSSANMDVAMRENSVILYEDDYKSRYEGFDPNSSESYIMFDFMQFAFTEQSLNLASFVQEQFKTTCNRSDRGVRQAGFLVLRHTSMPSVLVELGYISNPTEEAYLNQEDSQKELAQAIYNAFLIYKANYEKKNKVAFDDRKKADEAAKKDSASKEPEICYSVQFYTSPKSRPANSKEFKKCVPAKELYENKIYKYFYGDVATYAEALKIKREAEKQFKDAFIVVFKNGKKLPPLEARKYFK
jgi:N-acetylmuramoyl-L-alanine amidase